ncbi:ParB/RepB/Spo0J family partition protein [soil metagenome]
MYHSSLREIPVDKIQRAKYQPRQTFDASALAELAESIKSSGLIQPIVVRPLSDHNFEIVAGERRWRASQLAGLQNVTCLVKNYSDEQAAAVSTIENVNRVDLNPIEEARAYQRLIDEFQYLHEEVAAVIGKSRTSVTNSLRLLQLDNRVQQLLVEKKLSEGHGKCLVSLAASLQYKVALLCAEKGWSVRKLEQEVKKLQQPNSTIHAEDPNIIEFERLVSDQMGAQVKLDPDLSARSGWLKIRYFDNETLAGVLDKMGIKYE